MSNTILKNSIVREFQNLASTVPDRIALVDRYQKMTYADLETTSDAIAARLAERGIGNGDLVGIFLNRSIFFIAAVFGVLKTGGAFLPLDPVHSRTRNAKIWANSRCQCLLTTASFRRKAGLRGLGVSGKNIIEIDNLQDSTPDHRVSRAAMPEELAYVIYTSGTTGEPKGTMNTHAGLIHLRKELGKLLHNHSGPLNIALVASFAFDAAIQQVFTALLGGHTLFVVPAATRKDGNSLLNFYYDNKIQVSDLTPAHLKLILVAMPHLKLPLDIMQIWVGGESLNWGDAVQFLELLPNPVELTNVYGVAECSVDSLTFSIKADRSKSLGGVPIGLPLGATEAWVLDADLKTLPETKTGVLHIAGPGVGRGYLRDPALTAKRFIPHPFSHGKRLYATGDLVSQTSDGQFHFVGRADRQINIRGFRVELGEIEAVLAEYLADRGKQPRDPGVLPSRNPNPFAACALCLLDSSHPLARIVDGRCFYCREFKKYKPHINAYFQSSREFEELVREVKRTSRSDFDCLLLYSGGKDSTYTLYKLIEMGLRVMTFTFDNGYISRRALANIKKITEQLGIRQVTCSLKNMKDIFAASLSADATVCSGCFRGLTALSTAVAHKCQIPMVISGLSRGQIFDTKLKRLFQNGIFHPIEIEKRLREHREVYHSIKDGIARLLPDQKDPIDLSQIRFVDYFRYDPIKTPDIKAYLAKKDDDWKRPRDTGFCSTNCRINNTGIWVHKLEKGFHNYAEPLSWDIRFGLLPREEGLKEVRETLSKSEASSILKEVGYQPRLVSNPRLNDVAVLSAVDRSGAPRVAAFFRSSQNLSPETVKGHLKEALPDYMVPQKVIKVEAMPITTHGKKDYQKLASLAKDCRERVVPAKNSTEKKLVALWKKVLDQSFVGIDSNFLDLGGDSLSVGMLIEMIDQEFSYRFAIPSFLEKPTIRATADVIDRHKRGGIECLSLSPGRLRTSAKKIFLLPGIWGATDPYRPLGRVLSQRLDVWALGGGLDAFQQETKPLSVVAIGGEYLAKIRSIQAEGPYFLGGWSLGGVLAFEVARQLQCSGQSVEILAILDARAPISTSWQQRFKKLLEALDKRYPNWTRHVGKPKNDWGPVDWTRALSKMGKKAPLLTANETMNRELTLAISAKRRHSEKLLELALRLILPAVQALSTYRPQGKLDGRLISFQSQDSCSEEGPNWGALTRKLTTHLVESTHVGMLKPPYHRQIAADLERHLA